MKTLLFLSFITFFCKISFAQFPVTQFYSPIPGSIQRIQYLDTANLNPGPSGTNQTWNFSNRANAIDTVQTVYVNPSATPYFSNFSQSTIASRNSVIIDTSYSYYKVNGTEYTLLGVGNSQGMITYNNPETIFTYPLNYGQTTTDDFYAVSIFSNITTHMRGNISTNYDGYGILMLQSGSYNAIRIKFTSSTIDSVFYGGIFTSVTHTYDTTYYWFTQNYRLPVYLMSFGTTDFGRFKSVGIDLNGLTIGIRKISSEVPDEYSLLQNYPNPFNPTTKIKYTIKENSDVLLTVYNVLGQKMETLVNQQNTPGIYEVDFNAAKYSSGIYFYTLQTGNFIDTKKMIIKK